MYLRWLQWMLHSVHENHNTVVINMDETSMSNVTRWKHGWAVCSRRSPHERKRHKPKPAREMKITLIGAICNRPDMQSTLPQVLLPKHPGGRTPGKRILKMWEDMGAPLQVWHNTGGWNNAQVMTRWLRCISDWVKSHVPDMRIVLIMDCFSVHMSEKTLQMCRRLHIDVVLIPARMTWLLQFLDTDVFAILKRELRRRTAMVELSVTHGQVSTENLLSSIGQAIQTILVTRPWLNAMHKVGIGLKLSGLRPGLTALVAGTDMNPRPPSSSDLQSILNLGGPRPKLFQALIGRHLCATAATAAESSTTVKTEAPVATKQQTLEMDVPTTVGTAPGTSSSSTSVWPHHDFIPGQVVLPRGVRLTPPARNVVVKEEQSDVVGPAAGTRSRTKRTASHLEIGD